MAAAEEFVVGPVERFPEGSKEILEVGGRSIGVYHSNGQFYAVQNLCPHALAPICVSGLTGTTLPSAPGEYEFGMEGLVLRCPWHSWEYDVRTGEALFGTDKRRLLTFPVKVENGQVVVTMRARSAKSATDD
jgi:nitrite reductase (NADH) small subunit